MLLLLLLLPPVHIKLGVPMLFSTTAAKCFAIARDIVSEEIQNWTITCAIEIDIL